MTQTRELNRQRLCSYRLMDNGIHEFVFHDTTKASVDVWMSYLHEIYKATPKNEVVLQLVDYRIGLLPLAYASQRVRAFQAAHPARPRTRFAALQDGTLISLVRPLAYALARSGDEYVQLFPAQMRDDAIAWLLAED